MNKVKRGDTVAVIAGKDNGKQGEVMAVIPDTHKVVVKGVNIATIAKKARKQNEKSELVKVEKAIDVSNVMVICPTCKQPTRVKFGEVDGKKVRLCVKCGAVIADEKRETKKVAKKEPAKRTRRTKKETEEVKVEEEVKEVKKTTRTRKPKTEEVKD